MFGFVMRRACNFNNLQAIHVLYDTVVRVSLNMDRMSVMKVFNGEKSKNFFEISLQERVRIEYVAFYERQDTIHCIFGDIDNPQCAATLNRKF